MIIILVINAFVINIESTIDMNIPEFQYIADHLTLEECVKLVAALHFVSYELPAAFSAAERKVPEDVPCINLLINWNSGKEQWEGRGKTHEEVEHRLRQIGKINLADWLGKTVFHQLAKDINDSLINDQTFNSNISTNFPLTAKIYQDKEPPSDEEEWTAYDSILWVMLVGLTLSSLFVCYKIIHLTYSKLIKKKKNKREESVNLINNEETSQSDDELQSNSNNSSARSSRDGHSAESESVV